MGKKKRGSGIPIIDGMINFAGGLAMSTIADHMEEKYHYSEKGKTNPYAVSAFGIATGRLKHTEDLIRTGGFLGAAGSFDVNADVPKSENENDRLQALKYTVSEDAMFASIQNSGVNNNKYAWRMNCEDGSDYGISPNDYETRSEYNSALAQVKNSSNIASNNEIPTVQEAVDDTVDCPESYIYCKVSRLDNGENQYFRAEAENIKIGETVTVPIDGQQIKAIVLSVEKYTSTTVPTPLDSTPFILIVNV